jgi:hypothetical protein
VLDEECIDIAIVSSYGKDLLAPEKLYDHIVDGPRLAQIDRSWKTGSRWRAVNDQGRLWRKMLGGELRLIHVDLVLGRHEVNVVELRKGSLVGPD